MKIKSAIILPLAIGIVFSCIPDQSDKSELVETSNPKENIENTEQLAETHDFQSVMENMHSITYELKEYKELPASNNFLNTTVRRHNKLNVSMGKAAFSLVDERKIKQVIFAKVKSIQDMGGNVFPRADIEIWTCANQTEAESLASEVEKIKEEAGWDRISKSPITYWQQGKRLVFITPGGFYMLDKVAGIEEYLKSNLKE